MKPSLSTRILGSTLMILSGGVSFLATSYIIAFAATNWPTPPNGEYAGGKHSEYLRKMLDVGAITSYTGDGKVKNSDSLDTIDSLAFQKKIRVQCPPGQYIVEVRADGTLNCMPPTDPNARSCRLPEPACIANDGCDISATGATVANQAWQKDAPTCGYRCKNGYTGNQCEIAPLANTIAYYGDSTIRGADGEYIRINGSNSNFDLQEAYANPTAPRRVEILLREYGCNTSVINYGINGSSSADLLASGWTGRLRSEPSRYIIINHALNDAGNRLDIATYRSNLRTLIDIARSEGRTVILETPNPVTLVTNAEFNRFNEQRLARIAEYVAAMTGVALEKGVPVIDNYTYLNRVYSGRLPSILPDGLHPNQEGYDAKGYNAANFLNKNILNCRPALCASRPNYPNADFVDGDPQYVNQAWIKGASSCGFTCKNGYNGDRCEIPPQNGLLDVQNSIGRHCDIGGSWGWRDARFEVANYSVLGYRRPYNDARAPATITQMKPWRQYFHPQLGAYTTPIMGEPVVMRDRDNLLCKPGYSPIRGSCPAGSLPYLDGCYYPANNPNRPATGCTNINQSDECCFFMCQAPERPLTKIDGQCGNDFIKCTSGDAVGPEGQDISQCGQTIQWNCEGSNGGTTVSCKKLTPECGPSGDPGGA